MVQQYNHEPIKGITGMTMIWAISRYGKYGIFHTMNELDPSTESSVLPLIITVTVSESAIAEFFALVKDMLKEQFVTCQSIEVLSPLVTL